MRVKYDERADALYIYVNSSLEFGFTIALDENRMVDVDPDGRVIGIEVLSPSVGFQLGDVIERFDLEPMRGVLESIARRHYQPAASKR
ncbi:MAG: DUF2283 domain-containing protein [Actinomycetota bacterium]